MHNGVAEFAALMTAYVTAKDDCASRMQETYAARSAECAALNKLNDAQKALDVFLDKQRSEAPSDSDWGRARRPIRETEA